MEALKFYLSPEYGDGLASKTLAGRERIDFVRFAKLYMEKYVMDRMRRNVIRNAVEHFTGYQEKMGVRLYSHEMSKELLECFADYLVKETTLANSTIGAILRIVKFLLRKCNEYGYAYNPSYMDAKFREGEVFAIALEKREIARLYYAENCGLTKRQKEIRDLFVLECQTGFRYSDLRRLKKEHIINNTIQITMKKTRRKACVPLDKYVREIFEKYGFALPKAPTIQSFNKMIKEICRKAGLTRVVAYETDKGGELVTVSERLYKLVSTHTGRRSFVTNMLRDGVQETAVMKCTGHQSMSSFARYNKISPEENAIALSARTI